MPPTHANLSKGMHVYKAHVKDGKIELDEPADLPEGAEVEVKLVKKGEMSAEEQRRLDAAILQGIADCEAGRDMDMDDFLAELESTS